MAHIGKSKLQKFFLRLADSNNKNLHQAFNEWSDTAKLIKNDEYLKTIETDCTEFVVYRLVLLWKQVPFLRCSEFADMTRSWWVRQMITNEIPVNDWFSMSPPTIIQRHKEIKLPFPTCSCRFLLPNYLVLSNFDSTGGTALKTAALNS